MLKIVLLLVLFQSLETVLSSTSTCPTKEDLQPCYCSGGGPAIWVYCESVNSVEDVRRALSSTKGIKNVNIEFRHFEVDKIPSDLFKGLDVKEVAFKHCDLKSFGDDGRLALEGLEDTLKRLTVSMSFPEKDGLKFLNISGLRAIEYFESEYNYIKKLGNDWFRDGPTSLTNLYLLESIEEVGDEAFANLVNLRTLHLFGDKIKVLKRSMFPSPATHLYSVDFRGNKLSSLPEDIFSNMPALKEVELRNNDITHLPEATWSPVWRQLTRVIVVENPLVCDSHIEWMFKIDPPRVFGGRCAAPPERKDKYLDRIIKNNS